MNRELINKLIHDLEGEWTDDVRSAVHALVSLGPAILVPLLRAFEQGDSDLKTNAAHVLKEMQPDDTLPMLVEHLETRHLPLQSKTILTEVLTHLLDDNHESAPVQSLLEELVKTTDEDLKLLVTQALGKCAPVHSGPLLRELSADSSRRVRSEAQRLLAMLPRYSEDDIPLWNTSSFEAAARLRVRNGLSQTRSDAIQTMLNRGDTATEELLPYLDDAGEQTFEAMSPILQGLDANQVVPPLTSVIRSAVLPPGRRVAAMKVARDLSVSPKEMSKMYRDFLEEESPELRFAGVEGLFNGQSLGTWTLEVEERSLLLKALGELLCNEREDVRYQASHLLSRTAESADQSLLRYVMDVLHRYPSDTGRVFQMEVLARLMENLPSIQFLLPELLDFVGASRGEALSIGLTMLEKFVPSKPSTTTADKLLTLLQQTEDPGNVATELVLLERVLPRNYAPASAVLCGLEERFGSHPLWGKVLALCGRICDQTSVDVLIRFAQCKSEEEEAVAIRQVALDVLGDLDGTLREVWLGDDGKYHHRPAPVCACGGRLTWQPKGQREALLCSECDSEYLQVKGGAYEKTENYKGLLCVCSSCSRKQVLSEMSDGTYICPASGDLYAPRFDTKELLRISSMKHGACTCCSPKQPLEEINGRIVCIQTKRSLEEVLDNDELPVIDTLEIPTRNANGANGTTGRRTPTTLTSTRAFRLRQTMLPELTSDGSETDDT
ncbi:MAG: hypothetical protein EP343_13985 [Deltaproteobacteria bacterium]|nr:MAG: hypothetical protein EP343_13985 [Deltaproteobacteria bacterium]